MPFLFHEIAICDCGRPAQAGSRLCRTCYEDGWRHQWRDETRYETAHGAPAFARPYFPAIREEFAPLEPFEDLEHRRHLQEALEDAVPGGVVNVAQPGSVQRKRTSARGNQTRRGGEGETRSKGDKVIKTPAKPAAVSPFLPLSVSPCLDQPN